MIYIELNAIKDFAANYRIYYNQLAEFGGYEDRRKALIGIFG